MQGPKARSIESPIYRAIAAVLWLHRTGMDGGVGFLLRLPELYTMEHRQPFPMLYYAVAGTDHVFFLEALRENEMVTAPRGGSEVGGRSYCGIRSNRGRAAYWVLERNGQDGGCTEAVSWT